MITAQKSALFERVFSLYNRNLFKRRFANFRVAGLDKLRERNKTFPLILYANHSSWWDPLVAFWICQNAKCDVYAMMQEKNLQKLPFFRKIGAFSVVRESPREAVKSIRYAVNLLRENPKRTILIFPQGEILPNDVRPLKFYNGLARIIEQTGKCLVVPLAMRYEFLDDFKPEAFARVSELEIFENNTDSKQLTLNLSEKLTKTLDSIKADILEMNFDDYEVW
jgi:1-acyl-sn-glycerol-3-phosphate acyltransferase